jgi:hypothetical protein
LKSIGWEHRSAPNKLDDWWYFKTGHTFQDIDDLERGVHYFRSPDEVIAYCRERDEYSQKDKKKNKNKKKLDESYTAAKKTTPPKDSKKRGRNDEKATEKDEARNKRGKKRGSAPSKKVVGKGCDDMYLKVDSNTNEPPWAANTPLFEHNVVINSSFGFTYRSSYYYLPEETSSNFTERFESVTDLVQYCARSGRFSDPTKDEDFYRYIQYAFVAGKPSEWKEVRMLSREEAAFLLEKAGYSRSSDGAWKPPESLITSGEMDQSFNSIDALCAALRRVDDLEGIAGNSRRRKPGNLTPLQLLALRLCIAEGFGGEQETFRSGSDEATAPSTDTSDDVNDSQNAIETPPSTEKMKKTKRRRETEEKIEEQKELSPDKIKVKFRGQVNDAPWASVPGPTDPPVDGWHRWFMRMGCSYTGSSYVLPGENPKTSQLRFSSIEEIQVHVCESGNYDMYLQKLDDDEKGIVERYFNYGHVPGKFHDWKMIRKLTMSEVLLFLNLLGFEKGPDGLWKVPAGVPLIEKQQFSSLSALGRALVRVPDLEDRSGGGSNRRRARKYDNILHEKQLMALRLRLAEGLDDDIQDDTNKSSSSSKRRKQDDQHRKTSGRGLFNDDSSNSTQSGTGVLESSLTVSKKLLLEETPITEKDFKENLCAHSDAWIYLQKVGCRYISNSYRLPGSTMKCENQYDLVAFILSNEKGVNVLDWKSCRLTELELQRLNFYLRCFYIKRSSTPTAAFDLITDENIRNYLQKIGVVRCDDGRYKLGQAGAKKCVTAEIVNKIRCTEDLIALTDTASTSRRRQPVLTETEQLALRLWAAGSVVTSIPLPHFPDASDVCNPANDNLEIIDIQDDDVEENGEHETPKSASKVGEVFEKPFAARAQNDIMNEDVSSTKHVEKSRESADSLGQQKEVTTADVEQDQNNESSACHQETPQSRASDLEQFDTPMEVEEKETGSATKECDLKEPPVERSQVAGSENEIYSMMPDGKVNEEEDFAVGNELGDHRNEESKEASDDMKPASYFDDTDADELTKHAESLDRRLHSPYSQPGNIDLYTQPEEDMKPAGRPSFDKQQEDSPDSQAVRNDDTQPDFEDWLRFEDTIRPHIHGQSVAGRRKAKRTYGSRRDQPSPQVDDNSPNGSHNDSPDNANEANSFQRKIDFIL